MVLSGLVILTSTSILLADNRPVGNSVTRPVYRLPKDPKSPVITLDYRGGYTPPKISDKPTMSILADGTVILPKKFAHAKAYKGKLTAEELQDLLHFIIGTNEFFKYDAAEIKRTIDAEKQRITAAGGAIMRLADAATVVVRVHADGRTNEASYYPSGIDESKIKPMRQFAAIRKRLQQVSSIVQLGGSEKVAKWLQLANAKLHAQFPDVKPLEAKDLQSGAERADGSIFVHFTRIPIGADGKPIAGRVTSVTINQRPGQEPKVTVTVRN